MRQDRRSRTPPLPRAAARRLALPRQHAAWQLAALERVDLVKVMLKVGVKGSLERVDLAEITPLHAWAPLQPQAEGGLSPQPERRGGEVRLGGRHL
eukprot:scaffold36161_cov63-Phaeocystis_antarctica.AAC.3